MKTLVNRLLLRYHEGKGPTMTLAQADATPDWAPLWVCVEPNLRFHCARTFDGHPVEMFRPWNGESSYKVEKNPSVVSQKADLLLAIPPHLETDRSVQYLKIINASVPQCVSNLLPRARLLAAPQFRALHERGYFSIVTSAYAERFLEDPEAQKVVAVLRDLQSRANNNYDGDTHG